MGQNDLFGFVTLMPFGTRHARTLQKEPMMEPNANANTIAGQSSDWMSVMIVEYL